MMGSHREMVDEIGERGVEDMINLLSLTEDNLLKNLRHRYDEQLIYTYTGSILVAVNPYRMFNIYGLDVVKQYEDQMLGDKPPHLFAIGGASFSKMNKDNENQVIIISGESGAGKTESTKLLMQYLAAVNKSGTNIVTERILEANPLLESFGNAKTIRNDNSSRFGKYVELYFKGGSIVGAKTSEYLLEKSRIVSQAADERNYHVFYELLSGLDEEEKLKYGLTTPEKYFYLNQGGSCLISTKHDSKDFKDLKAAMEVLGFKIQEQETICKILASVLHLGNIYFKNEPDEYQHETVAIGSDAEIKWVCHLLQLDEDWLRESLTKRVTEARQERMVTPLNNMQAQEARDAVAKALYQRLFSWLVERINQIVKGPDPTNFQREKISSIAILDIFGFEDFRLNSFEQLCINYANESLQFYFNKHIFKIEQQEYTKERINWTKITFHDNQPTIDLIAKRPQGIIYILDDESNFPKGTDQSFLEKCHFAHTNNSLYEKPRMSAPEFSIKHYAGKVTYNVKNFLDKNRDTLRAEVVQLLIQSKNDMISDLFRELRDSVVTKTISKVSGLYVTMKPKTPTVAASFHESLLSLIDNMAKCHPWFVRCIKPNNHKAALMFETDVVLTQLRYTGMLETIKIRKMGYPVRYRYHVFAEKYFVVMPHKQRGHTVKDDRSISERVLKSLGDNWDNFWQIGLSKIFLKEKLSFYLDHKRNTVISEAAVKLQRFARGFVARKRYSKIKNSAIVVQTAWRAWKDRSRYLMLSRGIVKAQAQYRMHLQRKRYIEMLTEHKRQGDEALRRQREEARVQEARLIRAQAESERKRRSTHNEAPQVNGVYDTPYSVPQQSAKCPRTEQTLVRMYGISYLDGLKNMPVDVIKHNQIKQMPGVQSVAHLEIPRPLANIFRKLDGKYPVHSAEQNILKTKGVQPMNLVFVLPDNVDNYAFSKYARTHFQDHEWRMKKAPVTKSFLKDSDSREAVIIFKLIMRYMHDRTLSERQQKTVVDFIVQTGLSDPSLRDEILVQICNQTWVNKDEGSRERGWILMACCLSCFPPSDKLAKFLLKYVSDHGVNEYKVMCQHKLLQCINAHSEQKRDYPPCLLEWRTIKDHTCMALQGNFSDRDAKLGQVESWTTAEEFASHLLQKCRGVQDGHHGWTLQLREDNNEFYEYAGYDYVLDLISEMELEPGFPHNKTYYLTGMDRRREGSSIRRDAADFHPHNTEDDRLLELNDLGINELLKPAPSEPRPGPDPQQFFKYNSVSSSMGADSTYSTRMEMEGMLSPSVLNKRKNVNDPDLANSILNVRYITGNKLGTKRPAPAPPSGDSTPRAASPEANSPRIIGDLAPVRLNERYVKPKDLPENLAKTKLNKRYTKGAVLNGGVAPNGHLPNGNVPNGGHAKQKYTKNHPQPTTSNYDKNARDKISRQRRSNHDPYSSGRSDVSEAASSDMDHWVDQLFEPVLTPNVDNLSDVRSLEHNIRGGGDLTQPYSQNVLSPGYGGQSSFNVPYQPPTGVLFNTSIPAAPAAAFNTGPALGPTVNFTGPGTSYMQPQQPVLSAPIVNPMQQFAVQQQMAAAQQAQQMAAQQVAQQEHGRMLREQQFRDAQEQSLSLQAQLQAQQLQTQILQQSLQSEILKRQLHDLQEQTGVTVHGGDPVHSPPPLSPPAPAGQPKKKRPPAPPKPFVKIPAQGEIDDSRPGGVQTLKKSYESKLTPPAVTQDLFRPLEAPDRTSPNRVSPARSPGREVKFSEAVETIPEDNYTERVTSPVSPSPPPVVVIKSPSPPPQPKQASPLPRTPSPLPKSPVPSTSKSPPKPAKSPSPPPQTKPATPPPSPPQSPPPPPPPPPIDQDHTPEPNYPQSFIPEPPPLPPVSVSEPVTPGRFVDGKGTIRIVKVGKIQWPPPIEEFYKPQRDVGKLNIEENLQDEEDGLPKKSMDVHRRINEMIAKAQQESQTETPTKKPYERKWEKKQAAAPAGKEEQVPSINMKERQRDLEDKLKHLWRSDSTPLLPPTPTEEEILPPPPPPIVEPQRQPTPPPVRKIEPLKIEVPPEVPPLDLDEPDTPVDYQALEMIRTVLFAQKTGPFFMYNKVPWSLEVRKELFTPNEKLEDLDRLLLNLIYIQIVQDVLSNSCIRITKEERVRAKSMLDQYGINLRNMISDLDQDTEKKRKLIEAAREWPCYFSRIYPATGGSRGPEFNYAAVSHSGVHLVTREKDIVEDRLKVIRTYRFEQIIDVRVPQPHTVQVQVGPNEYQLIYTPKAKHLCSLIDAFCIECEKDEMYVKATRNYITRDSTLLNFEKGDIIKLTNRNMTLPRDWLYGTVHGRAGMFPKDHIVSVAIHDVINQPKPVPLSPRQMRHQTRDSGSISSANSVMPGGNYTMLEFAINYFRKSPYKYMMSRGEGGSIHGTFKEISSLKVRTLEKQRKKRQTGPGDDWTWKEQVEMIRWTRSPIQISLLELSPEYNKIALECFINIMRYMGDYPLGKDQRLVDSALFILMQCHNYSAIRDEVYCQLIKQTTNNRSTKSDSETMGWRLLSIITAFFDVTDTLQPYLIKYLESVAYDNNRNNQAVAGLCLENIRKTMRYGGRKNVPSRMELDAVTRGRISKRQLCVLPGGAPVVLNVKSSSVVLDILDQVSISLGIVDSVEKEEYSLFYVIEDGNIYCTMEKNEYIFDVTTQLVNDKRDYYILFQRTSWVVPLRLEPRNQMYVDVMYHSVVPDYLDGFLLPLPNRSLPNHVKDEIALLGALQLRVMEKRNTPTQKETAAVIPKTVHMFGGMTLNQWSNQVFHRVFEVYELPPDDAKLRFIDKLSKWPLFGSTFFNVKSVNDPKVPGNVRLAISRNGVSFLNMDTQVTLTHYPLQDIISTRRVTQERGKKYLDMKIGNLMQQKVIRIETDQCKDIGTLIGQYSSVAQDLLKR